MHAFSSGEKSGRGPARSVSAIAAAAAGATVLFWLVGDSLPGGIDLQVGFLSVTFGLLLAITVGYSWTVDKVWRRAKRDAHVAVAAFKDDFLVTVSRELRSSLTGIVGFAQLVDPDVIGGDNAEAINTVITQSVELSRVVDDLTTAAHLDAGSATFEPEEVSVRDEVEEAARYLNLMGLDVSIECRDARVVVDRESFRHVLRNLLVNAHRHGVAPVSVRGHSFGDRYICQVVDQGGGVSPEYEATLSESFGTHRKSSGPENPAGMGLTVARTLADELDWDLTYRRVRGETHFILTLPLEKGEPETSGLAPKAAVTRIIGPRHATSGGQAASA